jgi:hypothetical protein
MEDISKANFIEKLLKYLMHSLVYPVELSILNHDLMDKSWLQREVLRAYVALLSLALMFFL